jgi:hypothetical protein
MIINFLSTFEKSSNLGSRGMVSYAQITAVAFTQELTNI